MTQQCFDNNLVIRDQLILTILNNYFLISLFSRKVDCFDKEYQSVLTADGKIVWVCGKRLSNWVKITKNTNQIAVLSRGLV